MPATAHSTLSAVCRHGSGLRRAEWWRSRPVGLMVAGGLLEVILLLGFLHPLSIWRQPDVIPNVWPLVTVLGAGRSGALRSRV